MTYDEANRVVTETSGVTSTGLQGTGGVSAVTSSYGVLVIGVQRDAQGRVTEIDYADAAKTTTQMVYDLRGRLVNTQTFRSAPQWWTSGAPAASGAPPGYVSPSASDAVTQGILESRSVTYDEADNPVLIADGRTPSEWPAGSKPVTKRMTYDDAYRVTRVEYLNPAGASLTAGTPTTDTWVDPFAAEDANYSTRSPSDPTTTGNPRPMPHAALPTRGTTSVAS